MKNVKLDDIRIDGGTQGRAVIDQPTVYSYLENMKEGDQFPAIETVFDGSTHWLVDGFHRYHAYKLLGVKSVEVKYKPGTLEEAQVASFGVNGRHGKPRTNEDKRKVVQAALEHPLTQDKSAYEIAKICCVSQSFVASIRDPEVAVKQKEAKEKSVVKKAEKIKESRELESITDQTSSPEVPSGSDGAEPSHEEIEAAEEAMKADQDMMYKMLEADDALAVAVEENKRLNLRVAQLEARLRGLMNERNEAVDMIQKLQKQIAKSKK
jgi:hypothetical protein